MIKATVIYKRAILIRIASMVWSMQITYQEDNTNEGPMSKLRYGHSAVMFSSGKHS